MFSLSSPAAQNRCGGIAIASLLIEDGLLGRGLEGFALRARGKKCYCASAGAHVENEGRRETQFGAIKCVFMWDGLVLEYLRVNTRNYFF